MAELIQPDEPIGRDGALARVLETLEGTRLVTVAGPPGVGKTRLAQWVGERWVGRSLLVRLVAARDSDDVASLISTAMAGPSAEADDTLLATAERLREFDAQLLILDNAEHLLEPVRVVVRTLSSALPNLRVLVTSREPLRLEAEAVVPLEPLDVEDAVRLFERCVRRLVPDFVVDDGHLVRELVTRLDRLPLAVELAAARTRALTPGQLLERLDQRFSLLASRSTDVHPRHATLEAAIAWSWDLMSMEERQALHCLAGFRSDFSLGAAEAALAELGSGALELVEGLLERSVLHVRSVRPAPTVPVERRFGLYESVREFVRQRSGETTECLQRHAAERMGWWLVSACEPITAQTVGPQPLEAVNRLRLERENLLGVVEQFADTQPDLAARAALVVDVVQRLDIAAARRAMWLKQVAKTVREPRLRVRVCLALCEALKAPGQLDEAERMAREALRVSEELKDRQLIAESVFRIGLVAWDRAQNPTAVRWFEMAVKGFVDSGDQRMEGLSRSTLGGALAEYGQWDRGGEELYRARELLRDVGDRRAEARVVGRLGIFHNSQQQSEQAVRFLEEAAAAHESLGDRRDSAVVLNTLGVAYRNTGRPEQARDCHRRALAHNRVVGFRRSEGIALAKLAALEHECGAVDEAVRLIMEGREAARAAQDSVGLSNTYWHHSMVLLEREQMLEAKQCIQMGLEWAEHCDNALYKGLNLGVQAAWYSFSHRLQEAEDTLEHARAALRESQMPGPLEFLESIGATVDVARAEGCLYSGRTAEAERLLRKAQSLVDEETLVATWVRIARRVLAVRLRRATVARANVPEVHPGGLLIGPGGGWFRLGHGAAVSIERRRTIARLLDVLGAERLRRPGTSVSTLDLFAKVWPGERAHKSASQNRVRVAVATLRKLGLGDHIRRTEDGYMIDESLPVDRMTAHDSE